MSLPIHRFETQARTVLLESRRLAERRKDAWITPHHLLWVLLSHSASPPANLTPALTAQSLESELDHTPAPERQLKFACVDPSLKQLLLNLIKASQAQATPAGVPELWDALSEAGILEDYQVAPPSPVPEANESATAVPALSLSAGVPEVQASVPLLAEFKGSASPNDFSLRGRDEALLRCLRLLSSRTTTCVLLVGIPGCGKTALLRELARRFAQELVPSPLRGYRLVTDLPNRSTEGAAPDFPQQLFHELQAWSTPTILVLDAPASHTSKHTTRPLFVQQLLELIQPHDSLKLLVSLTPEQLAHYPDPHSTNTQSALLTLLPLGVEATTEVLRDHKRGVEESHNVYLAPEALPLAARLALSTSPEQARPSSALGLLEKAALEYGVKLDQLALANPGSPEPKLLLRLAQLQRKQEAVRHAEQNALNQGNLDRASELHFETQSTLSTEIENANQEYVRLGGDRFLPECITPAWVAEIAGRLLGQAPELLLDTLPERLFRLKEQLTRVVVGAEQVFDSLLQALMRVKTPDGHLRGVLLWIGPQGSGKTTLLRALQNIWFGSNAESLVITDDTDTTSPATPVRTKTPLPARGLVHLNHLTKMGEPEMQRLKAWVSGVDSPFSGTVGDRLVVLEATLDSAPSSLNQTSDWLRFVGRHIPVLWLEHLDAILTFSHPNASERRRIAEDMLAKLQEKAVPSGVRITWEGTLPVEAVGLCPEDQACWGLHWRIAERLEQELAGQLLQAQASGSLSLKVVVRDGSLKLVRSGIQDQA
jgi:hypothetical protein